MKKFILGALANLAFMTTQTLACQPPPPHAELFLVGNKGENTVSFIELGIGLEIDRPSVSAAAPHEIAITPGGRFAAVVNYGDAVIDIFDVPFRYITATIDLGGNTRPHGLVALSNGGFVATAEGGKSIVVLSPNHDFSKFGPGPCPTYDWTVEVISTGQEGTHMVALSPNEEIAYTANLRAGTISRINLMTKKVVSAPAGKEVEGIATTRDGKEVWASVRGENKVIIYEAATLEKLEEIPVGAFPLRIILSPDGSKMVTSNLMDGSVSVIDVATRKVERTIPISGTKESAQVTLLFSDDGTRLYVAETGTNKVAEIEFSTGKIIRRLRSGAQGDGLAIVPAFPHKP